MRMPQMELETLHFWADGMYCRWLARPKGTLILGKIHKREHFYMVVQGAVRITDGASEAVELRAPAIVVSHPGTQRAVFALEDSICLTVHRTNKKNLEKLEAELVEPMPESPFLPGNILDKARLCRS